MTRHVHDRKRILRMKMEPGRQPGIHLISIQQGAQLVSGLSFCTCSLVSSFWRPTISTSSGHVEERDQTVGTGVENGRPFELQRLVY